MEEVQEQSGAHSDAVAGPSGRRIDNLEANNTVDRAAAGTKKTIDRQKLRRSFGFAWTGVAQTWRTEQNFRIEVAAGTLALLLGAILQVNLVPILLCCLVVLSLEIMNSALEAVVNLASPEFHPLAERAKDAAAGAVLLAAIGSVFVGLLVLGPPLWLFFWARLFGGV